MSINQEGVVVKMQRTDSVVLNVLSEPEFKKIHIQGSYSSPFFEDRKAFALGIVGRFGKDKFFITYASNITSHAAIDAAQALQDQGIYAEPYLSGMKEWSQAGLPTEGTLAKV